MMIIKKADSLMTDSEINQLVSNVNIWSLIHTDSLETIVTRFNTMGGFNAIKKFLNPIPEEHLEHWTIDADEYNFIMESSVEHLIVPVDTLATYSLSDSILIHSIDLPNYDTFNLNGSLSKKVSQEYLSSQFPIVKPSGDRYNRISLLKNSNKYQESSPDVDSMSSDIENVISNIIDPNQDLINTKYLNRSNIGMIYMNIKGLITPTIIVETRPNLSWVSEINNTTDLEGNYSFLNNYFEPSAVTYLLAKIRKILYRKGQPKEIRTNKNIKSIEKIIRTKGMKNVAEIYRLVYNEYTRNGGLLLLPTPNAITIWEDYKNNLESWFVSENSVGDIELKIERVIIKKLKRNFKNFMQDNSYTRPLSIKRIKEQYTSRVVNNIIREAVQSSLPGFKRGDGTHQGFSLEKSSGGLDSSIKDEEFMLKSPLTHRSLTGKMAFPKTGELELDIERISRALSHQDFRNAEFLHLNDKFKKYLKDYDDFTSLLSDIPSERLSKLTLSELLEIFYDKIPAYKSLLDFVVFSNAEKLFTRIFETDSPMSLKSHIKELLVIDNESSARVNISFDINDTMFNIKEKQGLSVTISIREYNDSSVNDREVVIGFKFNEDMGKEGLVIEESIVKMVRQRGPPASFTIDMNASSDYYIEVRKVISRIFSPELFYSPAGKTASGQVGGKLNPMHRSAEFLGNSINRMLSSNPNIIEIEPFKYDALTNTVRGIYILYNSFGTMVFNGPESEDTNHTWFTVDSRKAGPVRTEDVSGGSLCVGRFNLSKINTRFYVTSSECINFGSGNEGKVKVLDGGVSQANLDGLAPLMSALGMFSSNPSTGVSAMDIGVANSLERANVPVLGQSGSNDYRVKIVTENKEKIMGSLFLRSFKGLDKIPDSLDATLKLYTNISFKKKNTFICDLTLEGEGLEQLIEDLDLHKFTLGQTVATATKINLSRKYSYEINGEELMKFISMQENNSIMDKFTSIRNNAGNALSDARGEYLNGAWDKLFNDISYLGSSEIGIGNIITNLRLISNEDSIKYFNPEQIEESQKRRTITIRDKSVSVEAKEEDSEAFIIKLLILLSNIKDPKTLTLESFKDFINKNKSEIANKIITETTLGADYRNRGRLPKSVIRDMRDRRK